MQHKRTVSEYADAPTISGSKRKFKAHMRKASEINLLTDEDSPRKLNKKA